jgi:hypothetical protein
MSYVLWKLSLEDYDRWKSVFDADPLERGANGSKGGYVFRNSREPNEVILLLEWDEGKLERLQQLSQSPKMKEVQEQSGYAAPPEVYMLELADRPSE